MQRILFSMIILLLATACVRNRPWSKSYEEEMAKGMDAEVKAKIPNDKQRKEFVKFMLKRFKAALPNGMESVSADSLRKLSIKIGKEWGESLDSFNTGFATFKAAWSADEEQVMRDGFLKDWDKKDLVRGKKMCDCMILALKKMYPDSIILPVQKSTAFTIARQCESKMDPVTVK